LSEDGIRYDLVTVVQTCALPIYYVSGLPMFAVSLACLDGPLERGGVVLGVVRAPALGESFRAVRGAGGPEATAAGGGPEALSDAVFIVNKAYAPAAMLWDVAGGLMQ